MLAKTKPMRNRALLDMARDKPCLMTVDGVCTHTPSTTVAAHSNDSEHGKGKSRKADDQYSVWACHACHSWYDQGGAARSLKRAYWRVAHQRQVLWWRQIAADPLANARDRAAAQWALDALGGVDA